jgi:predicted MPP superfamily phosphohydrolase
MGWRIVIFIAILLAMQGFLYFHFVRFLKSLKFYKPVHKWWALGLFALFIVPFIIISAIWGQSFNPPLWFKYGAVYPFYIWMGATFFITLWLLVGKVIKLPFKIPIWIAKIFKPLREKIKTFKNRPDVKKVDYSRRKFVRYTTMAASTYAFSGAVYGMAKHDSYEVDYKDVIIENLPLELKGTTITLISDIHSGQYMDEKDMREYAEVINNLNSDIICIPGDFINFDTKDVHPLTRAFRDLKAKHGVYGTLGNHDFFVDAEYVAKAIVNESPIQLLRNENKVLKINGKDLYLLGVDDTRDSGSYMPEVVRYYNELDAALKAHDVNYQTAPKVLMCHKPYSFDEMAKNGFDLMLSGHTHGGQVVPFKWGKINISFASTVSSYIDGLYKIGKANMYVSRGLGSVGLPIRINCPPEVTVIKLV